MTKKFAANWSIFSFRKNSDGQFPAHQYIHTILKSRIFIRETLAKKKQNIQLVCLDRIQKVKLTQFNLLSYPKNALQTYALDFSFLISDTHTSETVTRKHTHTPTQT